MLVATVKICDKTIMSVSINEAYMQVKETNHIK